MNLILKIILLVSTVLTHAQTILAEPAKAYNASAGVVIANIAGSVFIGGLITVALVFRRERLRDLERTTVQARYDTLKAQLQPHFLFNSLNSLSELIQGDCGPRSPQGCA